MVSTPVTQKADTPWVLNHIMDLRGLVPTAEWHAEWWQIWLIWRTISCHSGQWSLCCPLSQAPYLRVMRCEGDSMDKISSHRFVNFTVTNVEPNYQGRGNLSGMPLKATGAGCYLCRRGRVQRKVLGGFEMELDVFSRNCRFPAILTTYIPQILITWQVGTYDISLLQKPQCFHWSADYS